ncbi:hypothetical protein BGZ98_004556 [Dissophora globulifera]|nr:hypothetical protein BGZ98_004556 [Dissophora globulifera]
MPKYYCDYCDIFLTHDSSSVRKAHNAGRNHLINVKNYYSELSPDTTQSVLNSVTKAYAEAGIRGGYPYRPPSFPGMPPGMMPPNGLPPRPPMPPHPSMFMRPPMNGMMPPPGGPFPPPPPGFPGAPPPGFAPPPPGQFAPGQFPPPGGPSAGGQFRPPFASIPPSSSSSSSTPGVPGSGPPGSGGPGPVMNSERKRRLEEGRD